jgi:hypothetical protein
LDRNARRRKGVTMDLQTMADWQRVGGAEVGWWLMMAEPPATFAVCRHYAGWMQMFRLYLLSHGAVCGLDFLEAVDALRLWEPHEAMARRIYDLHLSGDREGGQKRISVSGPVRVALADAFAAGAAPARADVFRAAYREVVLQVDEGWYRPFKQLAEGIQADLRSGFDPE